jgi:hypothetical protein
MFIGKYDKNYNFSEIERLENGKIKYRDQVFDGIGKPKASTRPGKKRMVLVKKGDTIKIVHYGAEGYKHNYSATAKKSYLARSGGIKNKDGELTKNDKFSPNYWARRDLWPQNQKADGKSRE